MGILYWIFVGLIAGAIAKAITPQKERTGWLSSILIGIGGSMLGGFIANSIGLWATTERGLMGNLLIAIGGAILMLFIYHSIVGRRRAL